MATLNSDHRYHSHRLVHSTGNDSATTNNNNSNSLETHRPDKDNNNNGTDNLTRKSTTTTVQSTTTKWNRRRTTDGSSKSPKAITVHEGSYANPQLRQALGILPPPPLDTTIISSTSSTTTLINSPKTAKRNVALLVGYLGTNYNGFQMNALPQQRTIQAELEWALHRSGGYISHQNVGYPYKYKWSVSGRTDKGVHASGQVVSLKLEFSAPTTTTTDSNTDHNNNSNNLESIRQHINDHLPKDISILNIVRTTKTFSAKTQRDRVQYQYLLPSFLLEENYELFLEQVAGICDTRPGQKYVHTNNNEMDTNEQADDDDHNRNAQVRFAPRRTPLTPDQLQQLQRLVKPIRSTKAQRTKLQDVLNHYQGTHSFHFFTKGMKKQHRQQQQQQQQQQQSSNKQHDPSPPPSAMRFIESIIVHPPITAARDNDDDDNDDEHHVLEWIPISIVGQSFLYHQIRKMIGLAVDVTRGVVSKEFLQETLSSKSSMTQNIQIPIFPAQGLFLHSSCFGSYNRRQSVLQQQNRNNKRNKGDGVLHDTPKLSLSFLSSSFQLPEFSKQHQQQQQQQFNDTYNNGNDNDNTNNSMNINVDNSNSNSNNDNDNDNDNIRFKEMDKPDSTILEQQIQNKNKIIEKRCQDFVVRIQQHILEQEKVEGNFLSYMYTHANWQYCRPASSTTFTNSHVQEQ